MGMCARMRIQGLNRLNRRIHTNVPEPDLAIPGARDEFAHAAALHMDVCDPLLVVAPAFDHGDAGFEALVDEADGAVAEAGSEDVAGDLVGGQGCDAGA
jgi:hypothetical protein